MDGPESVGPMPTKDTSAAYTLFEVGICEASVFFQNGHLSPTTQLYNIFLAIMQTPIRADGSKRLSSTVFCQTGPIFGLCSLLIASFTLPYELTNPNGYQTKVLVLTSMGTGILILTLTLTLTLSIYICIQGSDPKLALKAQILQLGAR